MLRLTNETADRLSVRTNGARVEIPPLSSLDIDETNLNRATLAAAEAQGALSVAEASELTDRGRRRAHRALLWVVAALREVAYFVAVIFIVFVMPGAILFFGSNVLGLISLAHGGEAREYPATVALISIGMQELCIVGASALPILLYFMFDREKLQTLREKFVRSVFRLDPSVKTMRDIHAKYGALLDENYGRGSGNRFLPGTRSPLLLATAVMTLGWTVALLNTSNVRSDPTVQLTELLTPTAAPATFAFLGAYFFTLNTVLRGYVRGDLRPKTYAHVAARTVTVVVLAFVLDRLVAGLGGDSSSASLLVFAFIAGVVPETVLVRLQEVTRGLARTREGRREVSKYSRTYETDPLTQLEGIDIYDRARLLDEGVSNVEGLAHHDVVELLLKTRIPAARLIDWVDQAILYIHCGPREGGGAGTQLHAHGIRTATDLERAHRASERRGDEDAFLRIVPTEEHEPARILTMLKTIASEDWMPSLRAWRAHKAQPGLRNVPEDFGDAPEPFPVSAPALKRAA